MKYIFTSQFLKVTPPATSFGDAWELLCLDLLQANDPLTVYQQPTYLLKAQEAKPQLDAYVRENSIGISTPRPALLRLRRL